MIAKSPDRGTFQLKKLVEKVELGEKTAESVEQMLDFFKSARQHRLDLEESDEWKQYNMEYDLRSNDWIVAKVKASSIYSQHLYAAMCNNSFIKNDVWPLLQEKTWSCSWRSAGGIIADMREEGDYINWYCSGIRDINELDDDQFSQCSKKQQEAYIESKQYVNESVVTDEIIADLLKLGWIVAESDNE